MKRYASLLVVFTTLAAGAAARAEEGRFDAQVFRPSAAPRDLVVVQKSEVIGHLSPTVGFFMDLGLDPLVLVSGDSGETLEAVGARFQFTLLGGIGLFDWADVKVAMPLVPWQSSDNLRSVGTEGSVQTTSVGDLRLSVRGAIPGFNRKDQVTRGLGMAVTGNVNLPTGSEKAFTGDGVLTYGLTFITDYRIDVGALVTANAGIWFRPEREFAGVRMGDMGSLGLSGEAYVVQSWGLSAIAGLYSYPSLTKLPDSARQIPAEAMLALRWQTKRGFTWTFGGSFGAACSFGSPALRFFSGLTWQPSSSREQEHINRILESDSLDPDRDGLIGEIDNCPDEPGRPENSGCPDQDNDGDGIVDREDECPHDPSGERGRNGCPPAFIRGDQIVILDQVHFATDQDVILEESKPILEDVAKVFLAHPEILEVIIDGHTDVRAGDAYNMNLSQRRVDSVRNFLIERGVVPERLKAIGWGHTQPVEDDSMCNRPDEELDDECKRRTAANRRVVFRITRFSEKE